MIVQSHLIIGWFAIPQKINQSFTDERRVTGTGRWPLMSNIIKRSWKMRKSYYFFAIEKSPLFFKHCSFNRIVGAEGKLEVFLGQVSGRK